MIYKDGSVGNIAARKEVILCAGVINSPQLLLLSGIGSAEELDKFQVMNHLIFSQTKSPKCDIVIIFYEYFLRIWLRAIRE